MTFIPCLIDSQKTPEMHTCLRLENACSGGNCWRLEDGYLKTLVRALTGLPRTSQRMFVGERFASFGHTLGSFSTDPLFVTLVQSRPGCAFCEDDARKLKRCGACNDVFYCGQLCQTFYWPRHRIGCCAATAQDRCNSHLCRA